MIDHECTLSETNAGGFVPVCECGWIGTVHPMYRPREQETMRKAARRDLTKAAALDEHALHLHEVRADIVRRSDQVLESIPRLSRAANATLQRRGRWGTS